MTIGEIQAYAYFFFTAFLVAILYGYIWHVYTAKKKFGRDYEQYSRIALDDDLNDKPVETRDEKN